jgi:hypothetical protein
MYICRNPQYVHVHHFQPHHCYELSFFSFTDSRVYTALHHGIGNICTNTSCSDRERDACHSGVRPRSVFHGQHGSERVEGIFARLERQNVAVCKRESPHYVQKRSRTLRAAVRRQLRIWRLYAQRCSHCRPDGVEDCQWQTVSEFQQKSAGCLGKRFVGNPHFPRQYALDEPYAEQLRLTAKWQQINNLFTIVDVLCLSRKTRKTLRH